MIGKPKELWESLKSLGMSNKMVISNFNAIDENYTLTYDTRSISKTFKAFSNLAKSLLIKLSNHPETNTNYNQYLDTILLLQFQMIFTCAILLKKKS